MNLFARTGIMWIVRGIASVVFGLLTLLRPASSITAIVILFGAYALVDGAFLLGFAFRHEGPKAQYVVAGLLGLVAGALTFMFPGLTAISLYVLIGAWAMSTGIAEIVIAISMRKEEVNVGGLTLAGVLSLACGVALLALPMVGVIALLGLVAAYAIVNGVFLVGAGFRIHHLARPLSAAHG